MKKAIFWDRDGVINKQLLPHDEAEIDAIYYCPHNIEDNCDCRKPKPGLFLKAANDWGISLEKSIAIGDSEDDIYAAAAAGCGVIIRVDFEKKKDFYISIIEKLIG